jgi:hypothetical protein
MSEKVMDPTELHIDAVRQALIDAGSAGLSGPALVLVGGWRFGSVIFWLRRQGWDIRSTREKGRVWRYTLVGSRV